ncbi:hypothetical protein [Microbispora sp. H11081]|uniref:hypothetical protein n=1 Tax=Microbispora sp. H11081 TaxID=2729107 RepID=UPI00147271BE|nr:hypothetical protein [Microbispora sp. H11081]
MRTASRRIGLGLLACASVVAALTVAGPAAGDARGHMPETRRGPEAGPRTSPIERAAAEPGLTASSTTSSRGTQQLSINVANGGTSVQNALCRGSRGCEIVQAAGAPYAAGLPLPAPLAQAPYRAAAEAGTRAAVRPGARARRGGIAPAGRGTGARTARGRVPAPRAELRRDPLRW